ncbi:hypothetical protein DRQ11_15345, partial [candidate division KSB1 bacterium]
RIFREMAIEKLRGVEIRNPVYYFTLHGGKFKYFSEFLSLKQSKFSYEPRPVIKDGKGTEFYEHDVFSTGHQELDNLIGGFKRGSFVLLEVLENVPFKFVIDATLPIVENFILQGRGVITVPYGNINRSYLINIYSSLASKEAAKKYYKVIAPCPLVIQTGHPYFCDMIDKCPRIINPGMKYRSEPTQYPVPVEHCMKSFPEILNKLVSIFKRETDQNVLFFLSFDKLETSLGPEYAEKVVMNIISRVRVGGDLCVGVTSPNLRINIKLKRMADYLFRVFSRGGTMFIYGVHPSTKIYNVNIDFSQAHPRLYFIPVV